ncbi:carbonic anhydrase 6-like [Hydractinia symbiolongicarpus]|uniref:carbonic anhydrase 6-like n=1 Tax=Hydractinia symbiolongicarpus TaxID=13093 RepID=UPI002551C25A|nr:carbonic anhydrase 6-like [Hydractinia symbiolongicarpus]XP_057297500.1 carbonic anhydrase 6-like [Hydractinia symbiolongicarpus]
MYQILTILMFAYLAYVECDEVCTADWNYKGGKLNGPKDWYKTNPQCAGSLQSPINIDLSRTIRTSRKNIISFHNYNKPPKTGETYTFSNNGHTLVIDIPESTLYYLKKGGNKFVPIQAHIHFGSPIKKGSEHSLNRKFFQGEMHLVHRNAKYRLAEVSQHSDGLLVIGVFLKLTVWRRSSSIFSQLGGHAGELNQQGNSVKVPAFPLANFIPCRANLKRTPYVNYRGSLTTPPCTENVDWVVLTSRVHTINLRDLRAINKVLDCENLPMYGNYRPVQATNGRKLYGVNMRPKHKTRKFWY